MNKNISCVTVLCVRDWVNRVGEIITINFVFGETVFRIKGLKNALLWI